MNTRAPAAADPVAKIVADVNPFVAVEIVCDDAAMTASDSIELVRVPQLTDRAPYAYAAVASEVRRLVFTAGACPLDEDGATVAVGDVAGQAEQVMSNLRAALAAAGADLTDVVKTTVYAASHDREDLITALGGRQSALRPAPGYRQHADRFANTSSTAAGMG